MIENQLKAIRKTTGMTQQEFAACLDISVSSVANIENGSREISKSIMKSLIEKYNVSASWLLTGNGPMFLADKNLPANDVIKIPLLSQKVSCGSGVNWESESNIVEYLDVTNLMPAGKNKKLYGFRVSGSSMMGAGIKDGDIVIFSSDDDVTLSDGIYVFSLDGDVYCKRLEFDPIARRIKIYSVRVADLEKAELLQTLTSTDEGFEERFRLFGRVWLWLHRDK